LEPFGVRIIGKPQASPTKNKDHRNTLRPEVLDYFKRLAEGTGLAYRKFISLYLLDCAAYAENAEWQAALPEESFKRV
jgi:hypothetical protein